MPITHVAMFRFRSDVAEEDLAALHRAVAGLPARIPAVQSFTCGRDLGLLEGIATHGWDYAVVATFADVAGYEAYRVDAGHREVIEAHILPAVAERASVQFDSGA